MIDKAYIEYLHYLVISLASSLHVCYWIQIYKDVSLPHKLLLLFLEYLIKEITNCECWSLVSLAQPYFGDSSILLCASLSSFFFGNAIWSNLILDIWFSKCRISGILLSQPAFPPQFPHVGVLILRGISPQVWIICFDQCNNQVPTIFWNVNC